jgi:hAT family C-terminal dimerisation region
MLSQDLQMRATSNQTEGPYASFEKELTSYVDQAKNGIEVASEISVLIGIDFWIKNDLFYRDIAPLAQDLITAPASQAYAERVFSLCGDMCAGKRNRASANLQKRVFLKANRNYIS